MYRIFTIAMAVSLLPVSENIRTGEAFFTPYKQARIPVQIKQHALPSFFYPPNNPVQAWSSDWQAQAQENIRRSEYHFKWEEKLKAYCTPNRKNNLRFFYNNAGFSVEPRTTRIPTSAYDPVKLPREESYRRLPNWKVNFDLDKKLFAPGSWQIEDNTAEFITDRITVQYINNEEGMRQNFIVHEPLNESDELQVNFRVRTKLKIFLHNNQLQFFHKNHHVLSYDQLKVWDAGGKPLEASIKQRSRNRFYISVNTLNAKFPVTIDPISATPDNSPDDANITNANFGFSVASAGDVNGDGYSDVIIGARQFDDGVNAAEGRAFVYHGSATGLGASPASTPDDADQVAAFFGVSVSSAGDVNGDGYSDVIIGASLFDDGVNANEGKAFVYHGSATGISSSPDNMPDDCNQADALFGISLACAGDVNGDGYSDVIIGAHQYDDGAIANEGRAFVYHGSATGLGASPASTPNDSNQASAFFGFSVAGAGDVNGDGYSDVIIGAYQNNDLTITFEGKAYVYHGSASGIAVSPNSIPDDANIPSAGFGYSVASAGDVNGDGYSDVIIGAWAYDDGANTSEGRAFVYHGSATGIGASPVSTPNDANQGFAFFGCSVACAGDVNGDGFSDVIIGAFGYDEGANTNEGRAFLYHGSSTGIAASPNSTPDDADQGNAQFGISVASAGDVNGDGYSDIIIGANLYDDGANTNEGRAFVYHGAAAGISAAPTNTPDDADQPSSSFGFSMTSAGDVNGDGFGDVSIGSYLFDDGVNTNEGRAFVYHGSAAGLSASPNTILDAANQAGANFGVGMACAGDVNADGYSDVIVGAWSYDDGANADEGRAFVYHGSATGLPATPNSTPDDANQASTGFGRNVSSAGDVNGDGYSDVIIGAFAFDDGANTDEGVAFVYHGSATGLSATPNSIPDDSNQASSNFGFSVSNAGDVNGDGFSDVIVGAYFYDDGAFGNEGVAFVYHGSATGLSATPNNMPDDANQGGAAFGFSVSGAGDVNGDGFSDVIIGAVNYDDGAFSNEGVAFVYHGSAAGLLATFSSMPNDADQANALFGTHVSHAGDVNGDGYSDVIIGANGYDDGAITDEGRAFLYYGSATGLPASPSSIPDDANQSNVNFGSRVSGAGDINGDGYSDVIICAPNYDDAGNVDEGRCFIYSGNELTTNKRNNLRLYNSDLTTSLNSSNFIFANFGAGLFARSFLGRAKGKLVWETRLNYNAYSGTPITNSTFFTAQQASYSDLGLAGVELKSLIQKINGGIYTKLRARVKFDPVTAITGQVYGPWRNVSSIIDANHLGVLPVDLISFKVAWVEPGRTARIDFSTDKEIGICCFDIEKSTDGFNFYPFGSLPARNSSGIQSYSFVDANATGKKQFYRLKIKGMAAQLEYSDIRLLQYNGNTEILVFPNPTMDVLHLQLNKALDKVNVQIINTTGQVVKQTSNFPVTNQTMHIPVQNLAPGKYWLHLQSGTEKQLLQFIKQ